MKKLVLFTSIAVALLATACSEENLQVSSEVADGTEVAVTFTAKLPSTISTKAYNDGLTATVLSYAVYEHGAESISPILSSEDEGAATVKFTNHTATVSLDLVTNVTYDIIFWADSENSPYTFSADDQTVTVKYDSAVCNDEDRDAFFAATTIEVNGSSSNTITLYRPFAQINFGTDDLDAASIADYVDAGLSAKVTVSSAYQTLNLLTGEATNATGTSVEFALADIPDSDEETFPVTGYNYLAMNYILVPKDKTLVDCTLEVYSGETTLNTISVSNAPVQRNYRTNIYGSLLTSTTKFTVTIDPGYENAYAYVTTADEFLSALESGSNVTLIADIDLSEVNGYSASTENIFDISGSTLDLNGCTLTANNFSIVFEGCDFTITNGNLVAADGGSYGLFVGAYNTTDNVLISNVTVTGGINVFNSTNVVIEDVVVNGTNYYAVWSDENAHVTINSGTFTSACSKTTGVLGLANAGDPEMIICGGTFTVPEGKELVLTNESYAWGTPVIYGGTYNVDPSSYVATGYAATTDDDTTWTVSAE